MKKIGIFCSASESIDKMYFDSARQIGEWIGQTGKTLIYGGASLGLMECVARAVKENGGKVIGVVPTLLEEKWQRKLSTGRGDPHPQPERPQGCDDGKVGCTGGTTRRCGYTRRSFPRYSRRFHRLPPEKSHLLQRIWISTTNC